MIGRTAGDEVASGAGVSNDVMVAVGNASVILLVEAIIAVDVYGLVGVEQLCDLLKNRVIFSDAFCDVASKATDGSVWASGGLFLLSLSINYFY